MTQDWHFDKEGYDAAMGQWTKEVKSLQKPKIKDFVKTERFTSIRMYREYEYRISLDTGLLYCKHYQLGSWDGVRPVENKNMMQLWDSGRVHKVGMVLVGPWELFDIIAALRKEYKTLKNKLTDSIHHKIPMVECAECGERYPDIHNCGCNDFDQEEICMVCEEEEDNCTCDEYDFLAEKEI